MKTITVTSRNELFRTAYFEARKCTFEAIDEGQDAIRARDSHAHWLAFEKYLTARCLKDTLAKVVVGFDGRCLRRIGDFDAERGTFDFPQYPTLEYAAEDYGLDYDELVATYEAIRDGKMEVPAIKSTPAVVAESEDVPF